ncbi:MAG: hypothetical protein GY714_01730 [Desulfobacterales bacterium]|nr:hypothetical protein [Desulfobacterales bacterium]
MFKDNEIKISDARAFTALPDKLSTGNFEEKMTVEKLCEVMKWDIDRVPKLANREYTYKMRKILGQLTKQELRVAAKREAKELKIKRGNAKMKRLIGRLQ